MIDLLRLFVRDLMAASPCDWFDIFGPEDDE